MRHIGQDLTEGFDVAPGSLMAEYRRLRAQAVEAEQRAETITAEWANAKRNADEASLELTAAYEDDTSAADLRKLETKLANARKVLEKPWEERAKGAQGSAQHARDDLAKFTAANAEGLLGEIIPSGVAWQTDYLLPAVEAVDAALIEHSRITRSISFVMSHGDGMDPRRDMPAWNVPGEVRDGLRALREAPAPLPRPAPIITA